MRDNLYEIFIYNLDIHACLYYIIKELVNQKHITNEKIVDNVFFAVQFHARQ